MASFSETRAPTSRKYVVEQGLPTPSRLKTFQTFWSISSVFALEKRPEGRPERRPEKLNFQSFLHLRNPLVDSFNETRALTSRTNVAAEKV